MQAIDLLERKEDAPLIVVGDADGVRYYVFGASSAVGNGANDAWPILAAPVEGVVMLLAITCSTLTPCR